MKGKWGASPNAASRCGATRAVSVMLAQRMQENDMPKADTSAVKHIIANTIHETSRGDPDGLASRVIAALAEAGYSIVLANGMEDTVRGFLPLYRSANGDAWFLARDPATG